MPGPTYRLLRAASLTAGLTVALAAAIPALADGGSTNPPPPPAPPCNPDINGNGAADQKDVAYLTDFFYLGSNPNNVPASTLDFNRDGKVDKDDIADLINTVGGGGCPPAPNDGDCDDDDDDHEHDDDDDNDHDDDDNDHDDEGHGGHGQPRPCNPDINASGAADQKDILYLTEYVNSKANPNNVSRRVLDFNGDRKIDQKDISDLTNTIAGGPCPTRRRRDDDHGGNPQRPCQPDINGNGVADSKDVDYLKSYLASKANPNNVARSTLDFNGDGRINQKDVDDLVNKIAGGPCPARARHGGHSGPPRHCWSGWTGHDRDRLRDCKRRGDMTGDNRCDSRDASELARILATGLNPRGVNTDINRDGQTNNADLLDLMRSLGAD